MPAPKRPSDTRPSDVGVRVDALLRWYRRHARDLPWRRTKDPYAIWVSEVMLQQTQVRTVIPYWERWMNAFPTVTVLADAPEEQVLKLWEGLGYYRRARNLAAAARIVRDRYAGRFPSDPEAILELPGVGRYTAGAIGSIAFGQPVPILDGNLVRVFCRLEARGGDPKESGHDRALWEMSRSWVVTGASRGGAEGASHTNQALMELGATVCTPRSPDCGACPLAVACRAREEGDPESYPRSAPRARTESREFLVAVIEFRGRVWVRRREATAVNGGLWEFPSLETDPGLAGARERVNSWLEAPTSSVGLEPFAVVRHAITRYRITQRAFRVGGSAGIAGRTGEGRWCDAAELEALAMSSAHRKIARAWVSGRNAELHPS